jgi:hypothetical protein
VTAREKIDAAIAFLKSRGVPKRTAAPPAWRFLWSLGVHVPPPHFLGFFPIALLAGTLFGTGLALGLAVPLLVTVVPVNPESLAFFLGANALGGALFGTILGVYFRWSAARLGLPTWAEFQPELDEDEDDW